MNWPVEGLCTATVSQPSPCQSPTLSVSDAVAGCLSSARGAAFSLPSISRQPLAAPHTDMTLEATREGGSCRKIVVSSRETKLTTSHTSAWDGSVARVRVREGLPRPLRYRRRLLVENLHPRLRLQGQCGVRRPRAPGIRRRECCHGTFQSTDRRSPLSPAV